MKINLFYFGLVVLTICSAGITYFVLLLPYQSHGEDLIESGVNQDGEIASDQNKDITDQPSLQVADEGTVAPVVSSEQPNKEMAETVAEELSTEVALPVVHKTAINVPKARISSDKIPPSIPQSISAYAVSPSQVNISWHVAYDNVGVAGYYIYRDGLLIGDVSGLKYASVNLIHETKYRFEVASYDSAGNVSGRSYVYEVFTPSFPAPKATTTEDVLLGSQNTSLPPTTSPEPTPNPPPVTTTPNPTGINQAPVVSLGSAKTITLPATISLTGTVSDDGLPSGSALSYVWSKGSGPGTVTFTNPSSRSTTASFSISGSYSLCLAVSDSALSATSCVAVTVNTAQVASTYSVSVTSSGTISPASITIHTGDTVTFNFSGSGDEVKLTFSPSIGTTIKLDHEKRQKSYTFSNAGTFSYHKQDGGGTNATIIVQ